MVVCGLAKSHTFACGADGLLLRLWHGASPQLGRSGLNKITQVRAPHAAPLNVLHANL
jgi:hypothetical protein